MKIQNILNNFRVKCQDCVWNKEDIGNANCQICLKEQRQALKIEILKALPKERNYTVEEVLRLQKCDGTDVDYIQGFVSGNNAMLSDTRQAVEKLFGGEC